MPALASGSTSSAPLNRFISFLQQYTEQQGAGLSEDSHADFIRQCQHACRALIDSVTSHSALNVQAHSQAVQGLADFFIGEGEALIRELLATPESVQACTLFVATKFSDVNEFDPESLCQLANDYACGSGGEEKDVNMAATLYQHAAGLAESLR